MDSLRFSLPFAHALTIHALDVKVQMCGRCPRKYFSRILLLSRDLIILFTSFLVVGKDQEEKLVWLLQNWICLKEGGSSSRDLVSKKKYWAYITQTLCTFFFAPMYIATCLPERKNRPLFSGTPWLPPWLHSGPWPGHKGSGTHKCFRIILLVTRDLIILFSSFLVVGRNKDETLAWLLHCTGSVWKKGEVHLETWFWGTNIGQISHKHYALSSSPHVYSHMSVRAERAAPLFRCSLVDTLAPFWSMPWT